MWAGTGSCSQLSVKRARADPRRTSITHSGDVSRKDLVLELNPCEKGAYDRNSKPLWSTASGVAAIGAGFSWSVLFMLGMSAFVMGGGMILMMVRSCKQLAERHQHVTVESH